MHLSKIFNKTLVSGKLLNINPFAKNILKLGGATLFSQIVGFLILPILSRMYSPDDFGSLGVFLAITGFLAVVAGFKYENAIVLSVDDTEARNLYILSLSTTVFLSVASYLFFFVVGSTVLENSGYKTDSFPLYYISIYVLVFGLNQLNKQYFNYKSQFSTISLSQIIGRTSAVIPKLIFGFFKFGGLGLIIGELLNLLSQVLYSIHKITIKRSKIDKKELIQTAKKYIKFPKYELPMDFVNTLAQKLPVILMAAYFGVGFVGLYVFCNTIPRQIISLTSQNIGGVYYRKIANQSLAFQKEKTQKLLEKLFLIGVFPFMVLTFFSEEIYTFIFGKKWLEAGLFVQILSPSFFVLFLIKPISNSLFRILGKQNIALYLNLFYAGLIILIVYLAGIVNNKYLAVFGISVISLLTWAAILLYLTTMLSISRRHIIMVFLKYFLFSFVALSFSLILKYLYPNNIILILGSVILSVFSYITILFFFDKEKLIKILK
jgi:O-antigen/teichoic acid export membrane protein